MTHWIVAVKKDEKDGLILRISILIIIGVILVVSNWSGNSTGNPVAVDDRNGNSMTPFPYNVTNVYLMSESIRVTLTEIADVKTTYSFHNDADNSTNISILLPFWSPPYDIVLEDQDRNPISYYYAIFIPPIIKDEPLEDLILVGINYINFARLDSICFNMSFMPGEEKTIFVNYSRDYERYSNTKNNKVYCKYVYIVSTAKYWNHRIDDALFTFDISEKFVDDITSPNDYHIQYANGTYSAEKKFTNWNIATQYSGEISFEWIVHRNEAESNDLLFGFDLFIVIASIVICMSMRRGQ